MPWSTLTSTTSCDRESTGGRRAKRRIHHPGYPCKEGPLMGSCSPEPLTSRPRRCRGRQQRRTGHSCLGSGNRSSPSLDRTWEPASCKPPPQRSCLRSRPFPRRRRHSFPTEGRRGDWRGNGSTASQTSTRCTHRRCRWASPFHTNWCPSSCTGSTRAVR